MQRVRKITVVRPGALGDVLVTRGTLRFLRTAFPGARLHLLAPGERGRLFLRFGWVDEVLDWESAECAWLFSDGAREPGERVRGALGGTDVVLSYVDGARQTGDDTYGRRVADLNPNGAHGRFPSRPAEDAITPVGRWLLENALRFCRERGLLPENADVDVEDCLAARFRVDGVETDPGHVVMHPGSGGRRKNWPVHNFSLLAAGLMEQKTADGERLFSRLTVTAGEADEMLGEELCARVPGARLWRGGSLEELAGLLSGAALYVGNDSGVTHLASSVACGQGGRGPKVAAVFGPSNASVWGPPAALVLAAGAAMNRLEPGDAIGRVMRFFQ